MVRLIALGLFVAAACGNIAPKQGDAGPHDAAPDTPGSTDPPPDSAPLKEAREFVSGGTRMTSTTYTFDVQMGHGIQQSKITGTTYKFEGNAAVKP